MPKFHMTVYLKVIPPSMPYTIYNDGIKGIGIEPANQQNSHVFTMTTYAGVKNCIPWENIMEIEVGLMVEVEAEPGTEQLGTGDFKIDYTIWPDKIESQ